VTRNLVLIGMPGCGKSTAGVLLAKVLGLDFVDTDLLLQKQEGALLHQILARGAGAFLEAEDRLLSRFEGEGCVVSTGGSAVYHQRGMTNLKRRGTVLWLDVPLDELSRRLGDMEARGVVLAPGQTLAQLYDQRRPLYAKWADHRLEAGQESLETTVARAKALVSTPAP
jgi:shikimate kinase